MFDRLTLAPAAVVFPPRSALADACADRVNTFYFARDRDFGPAASFAGNGLYLNRAVSDFRHFERKKFGDEFWVAA